MSRCPSRFKMRRHTILWPRWTTVSCDLIRNHAAPLHQHDVGSPFGLPLVWSDDDDARRA